MEVVCCAAGLEKKVRELYDAVCRLEEEKYDWEGKLGRQTEEVCQFIDNEYCLLITISNGPDEQDAKNVEVGQDVPWPSEYGV